MLEILKKAIMDTKNSDIFENIDLSIGIGFSDELDDDEIEMTGSVNGSKDSDDAGILSVILTFPEDFDLNEIIEDVDDEDGARAVLTKLFKFVITVSVIEYIQEFCDYLDVDEDDLIRFETYSEAIENRITELVESNDFIRESYLAEMVGLSEDEEYPKKKNKKKKVNADTDEDVIEEIDVEDENSETSDSVENTDTDTVEEPPCVLDYDDEDDDFYDDDEDDF